MWGNALISMTQLFKIIYLSLKNLYPIRIHFITLVFILFLICCTELIQTGGWPANKSPGCSALVVKDGVQANDYLRPLADYVQSLFSVSEHVSMVMMNWLPRVLCPFPELVSIVSVTFFKGFKSVNRDLLIVYHQAGRRGAQHQH